MKFMYPYINILRKKANDFCGRALVFRSKNEKKNNKNNKSVDDVNVNACVHTFRIQCERHGIQLSMKSSIKTT